jgi:hypothetical protein
MVLLRKLLSIYKSDDSSSTKTGGFIRITGVWWAGVHSFQQFEKGLDRTGGDEHAAGGAVSLDESLGVLNARWIRAGQMVLLAVPLGSRAADVLRNIRRPPIRLFKFQ